MKILSAIFGLLELIAILFGEFKVMAGLAGTYLLIAALVNAPRDWMESSTAKQRDREEIELERETWKRSHPNGDEGLQ